MSIDKPWKNQYDVLLRDVVSKWRGIVKSSDDKFVVGKLIYPTYEGEINGEKTNIDITEFLKTPSAESRPSSVDFLDSVEYLRVHILINHKFNIQVTKEHFGHRFDKFLHLDKEFQTGNKEFDKKYFIRIKSDEDKYLIMADKVQTLINELEPFVLLEMSSLGLRWFQEIKKPEQLALMNAERYIQKLTDLAKVIHLNGKR